MTPCAGSEEETSFFLCNLQQWLIILSVILADILV